jgi:hypothetical protein
MPVDTKQTELSARLIFSHWFMFNVPGFLVTLLSIQFQNRSGLGEAFKEFYRIL